MERKNIILISISILLFIIAGYILYAGIFSKTADVISTDAPNFEDNQKNIVPLLPYGDKLDFTAIDKRTDIDKPFEYNYIDENSDVGVDTKDLIRNLIILPSGGPQQLTNPIDNVDRLLQYNRSQ